MKNQLLLFLFLLALSSCKNKNIAVIRPHLKVFTSVEIDTIFEQELSIRALLIDSNTVWYAANKGLYGSINLATKKQFNGHVIKDTPAYEFRSIAQTKDYIFLLNAGSPAALYRSTKDGSEIVQMYKENHPKVFYDSMHFWNDQEGIAMGDPTADCLSVLITRNGGTNWHKVSCDVLPKVQEGEAAFAASNTNIVVQGNDTWLVSGGTKARVFYSSDKGKSWNVTATPLIQGEAMTGIFTADFYDAKNGFIAGGNYEKLQQNFGNKAITKDGGTTWRLIAEHEGFGYASCVQYVPHSNAEQLVSVGASGLYYSSDSGVKWSKLVNDTTLFTIRFMNDSTALAAGKNKIIRLRFK